MGRRLRHQNKDPTNEVLKLPDDVLALLPLEQQPTTIQTSSILGLNAAMNRDTDQHNRFFPSSPPKNTPVEGEKAQDATDSFTRAVEEMKKRNRLASADGSTPRLTVTSAQQQNSNAGSIFGGGNAQATQPQQGGGLFGSSQPSQAPTAGGPGLFSNSNAPNQNTGNASGGLFGSSNTQTQNAGNPGGGLFGSSNTQAQNTGGNTGGLFGSTTAQNQNANNTGGLFGTGNTSNQNKATGGGSLFGGTNNTTQNQGTGSVFGNTSNGVFANPAAQSTNMGGSSLFGSSFGRPVQQPQPSAPSLLSATQHAQMNNSAPFGRLSMGQSAAGATTTVSAVKVNYDDLRPTTRFEDCTDAVKQELEAIDQMIQVQEGYCKEIEAMIPMHEKNAETIAPDVESIKNSAEDVEQTLSSDAQGVETQRKSVEQDSKDVDRCLRIITNLGLPQAYQLHTGGFGSLYGSQQRPQQQTATANGEDGSKYDTDLIGNYFAPMAAQLHRTMNAYANNLTEIENHMRVIDSSAVAQAHQLVQHRDGLGGNGRTGSETTVRELAATLRGLEQSILGAAGVVGECREGVNQLVLGRLGGMP